VIVDVVDWLEVVEAGVVDVIVMSGVWKVKDAATSIVRDPLVPVIVTVNVPSWVELQASVAVAGEEVRVMLAWLIAVQLSPLGSGVSESETVPANPLTAVTVIVEVALFPAGTSAGEVTVIEKSGGVLKVNVAEAVCVSDPLVPVIVTV
jgi:hypothetical protein